MEDSAMTKFGWFVLGFIIWFGFMLLGTYLVLDALEGIRDNGLNFWDVFTILIVGGFVFGGTKFGIRNR